MRWQENGKVTVSGGMSGGTLLPLSLGKHGRGGLIDAFCLWLESGSTSPGTLELRRKQLHRFLREHDAETCTADEMVAWLANPAWKAEYRRSNRSGLRQFFRWMQLTGRRGDDPTALTRPVTVPRSVPRPASREAFREALAKANQEDEVALLLAGLAGLRRHEIAALHADDIGATTIRVLGKGQKVRHVPIHPALEPKLRAWAAKGGYLFRGRDGQGPIGADAIGRRISKLLSTGAHSLRHKFATDAYKGSKDLRAVQELLGHADVSTTQAYTLIDDDDLAAAVANLAV